MKKLIVLSFIVVSIFSCKTETKNIPEGFDYGRVSDNAYINKYFNFKIDHNADWYALSPEELNDVTEAGLEYISGNDSEFDKIIDASQINVAQLFSAFKDKVGTTVQFNPSIIVNAENLKDFPEVKDVDTYLEGATDLLKRTGMDLKFIEGIHSKMVNGEELRYMQIENHDFGQIFYQDYFSILRKGFVVSFTISYVTQEDKDALYEMLDSLKFR